MRFAGKTAVVTGAASGMGRATAIKLAAEGATVIAADIDEAGGSELAAMSNGKIIFKKTDVCDVAQIKALMDFAAEQTGGIDIVFNNAGAYDDALAALGPTPALAAPAKISMKSMLMAGTTQ